MNTGVEISLRSADVADDAFLLTVYASTRAEEMALVAWTSEQKQSFVQMQFDAQRRYYLTHYPQAENYIVQKDGRPIGRMILDRSQRPILLMDIALLPAYRNEGLGTTLIESLLEEADRMRRPVQLHVESFNRAMRLYKRLGFMQTGEVGIYLEMTRQPKVDVYV